MAIDKLVDSAQLESDLTDIADAIRAKTGGTADLQFPADFVSEIGSISGGEGWTWDTFANQNTPAGAVSFETATSISNYAFYSRKGITSVDLTGITSIDKYAFADASNITEMTNADTVLTIATYAFKGCSKLGWLYFPNCTSITTGGYAFYGAGKAGYGVVFPEYVGTTQSEFMRSSNYTVCDLGPLVTALGTRHFYNDNIAYNVILRNPNAVVTAADTNRIPLNANTVIYVPSSLVESYQTASNWSTAYSRGVQFLPIEGSQYENYYADGTPIVAPTYYDMSTVTWSASGNDARSSGIPTGDNGILLKISNSVQIYDADTGARITGPGVYVTQMIITPSMAANISIAAVGHKNDIETWLENTTISVKII